MTHLLAADRVRFGHRRDLWIVVAVVPVILVLFFVVEFNKLMTPPANDFFIDPPDPVLEAQLQAEALAGWREQLTAQLPSYTFPASLVKVAGTSAPLILVAIYLAIALIAGEGEWGTIRTLHLTSSRGQTMAVRIGVVAGIIAVATAVGLVFASIIPFLLTVEGRPLQDFAQPVPDLLAQIGIRLAVVLPFIGIPALMAVLARSTGLAFLLSALLFIGDLAVTGAPFWSTSPLSWVPVATVSGSIARLLGGEQAQLATLAPAWVSVTALLAWAIVPAVAAVAVFRRIDINE